MSEAESSSVPDFMPVRNRQCRQCGTCCRKGGPSLVLSDVDLVRRGKIRHDQLLTIRRGELGYNPTTARLERVPVELLKVRGRGNDWCCLFFAEENKTCSIYDDRPETCRVLECWQPEALLATIYRDTVSRADLINPDDPVLLWIERHEQSCPVKPFVELTDEAQATRSQQSLVRLEEMIEVDLTLRQEFIRQTGVDQALELFLLGRPFFRQIPCTDFICREARGRILLDFIQ